jgi:hypothetical protein
MKTINKSMMILGLLFFALQGCTHDDYVPVPGPAGENGINGVAGTASCVECHSASHRDPIIASYFASAHNLGKLNADGTYSKHVYGGITPSGTDQRNSVFSDGSLNSDRAFCSQCHSEEGYIDVAKYGKPNPMGYDIVKPISCEGCHGQIHRSLDFPKNDYGLRIINAVTHKINPTFTLNASPTGGTSTSNTCVACHQARPDSNGYYKRPVLESGEKDYDGDVVITNTTSGPVYRFWSERALAKAMPGYPAGKTNYKEYSNKSTALHASPQADIWMGITGIDIEGSATRLPATKTAAHYKNSSCVNCHMDKPLADGTKGMHSLKVSFVACATCHGSAAEAETKLTSFHTDYDAKIETLRLALSAKTLYFNTSATNGGISIKLPALPTVTGSTDATVWDLSTDVPLKYAQAYWNYKLLTGDAGRGIHNPLYVKALIQNSIEALQ